LELSTSSCGGVLLPSSALSCLPSGPIGRAGRRGLYEGRRRRRINNQTKAARSATPTIPPTAPPAMAPGSGESALLLDGVSPELLELSELARKRQHHSTWE
jgi:hypothetical protein